MKLLITSICLLTVQVSFAQPTVVKQAVISTTTNIIAPEEEDVQNMQSQQGGGMNFRNMMDGEFKFTTYLKDDMVKTVIKSEMGRSTIIRDNNKKLTTTLIEMMGNKTGFYMTDEEQAAMAKRRDSMMQARRKKDSGAVQNNAPLPEPVVDISYTDESKKIAGYMAKKAYIITTRLLGIKDTAVVWYTPELKFENLFSTGGMAGFGAMMNMGGTLNGLDKLDGFVLRYEMAMRRNRRMEVEVTKIDLKKEITEKEFEIPKDFEVKPAKEMQNMFGGGQGSFQLRRGGN